MPQNFAPHSIRENEALIARPTGRYRPFSRGVYHDIPASLIPDGGIADLAGYIPKDHGVEAATGCRAWGTAILPALPGRTGYSLTKSGTTVTKTVGPDFTAADEADQNVIVYDDGKHERITDFINASQVTVETSTAHAASTAAWIRGKRNQTYVHRGTNKLLLHIDTRLFYADPSTHALFNAYTQIPCVSYRALSNDQSIMFEREDFVYIINPNGLFMVDMGATTLVYFKINSPVPTVLPTDVAKTVDKPYGYKYTFSMGRLSGTTDTRNRRTAGVVIQHETGTCLMNSNGIDYGSLYNERPVGPEDTTYDILTGGALSPPYTQPTGWSGITNGQFRMSINGTSYNFAVNFADCKTMFDVAQRLQSAMRTHNSFITVENGTNNFIITNTEEGGTVSYSSAGDGGTDIGTAAMACQSAVALIVSEDYEKNCTVGDLTIPLDSSDSVPQRHHTHYFVYRSLDYGENGINPITGEGNNEEQLIWVDDVPIAKVLVASASLGWVNPSAGEGTFQNSDIGSKLRFQDGTEAAIIDYDSATGRALIAGGLTISSQACAIGGDNALGKAIRVGTASQSGTTVTASAGITFSAADVGKTIFWAGGAMSHITAYTAATGTVTVAESATIASTGICMDPMVRKFNDAVSDDDLRARIANFSLKHRFHEPLPESDFGVLVPGFLLVTTIEDKKIYYQQVLTGKEYLIGSYNPDQYIVLHDKIKFLSIFPDNVIVYCGNLTEVIPVNSYVQIDVNGFIFYYKITGQYTADNEIGLLDRSLIHKLPDGRDWVFTNEPAIRIFDGRSYTANLAKDRYLSKFTECEPQGTIMYDFFNGISFFGKV